MKPQRFQDHGWDSDAKGKGSSRSSQEAEECSSADEKPSTPLGKTTLPKHKSSYLRFLTWIAYYRKIYWNIDEVERVCPVYECGMAFQIKTEMLQHVGGCNELQKGTYHCPSCNKYEKISRFHGDSCTQPHSPFQKARNSLRSVKSMFAPHDLKQSPPAVERIVSGAEIPQYRIELDSSSVTPELPSYHPINYTSELESPVSSNNGWSWSAYQGMTNPSTGPQLPGDCAKIPSPCQFEGIQQDSYDIPKYSVPFEDQLYHGFAELSAGPSSGEQLASSQGSTSFQSSSPLASQVEPSWNSSLPIPRGTSMQVEPAHPFNHGYNAGQITYRNNQVHDVADAPVPSYVNRESVSSTDGYSSTDATSRSSTVSYIDSASSSRNTSFSEKDVGDHGIQIEGHAAPVNLGDDAMFYDEPDEMEYFENQPLDFQPLGFGNDVMEPIEWPPQYLATTSTSFVQPTTQSAPFNQYKHQHNEDRKITPGQTQTQHQHQHEREHLIEHQHQRLLPSMQAEQCFITATNILPASSASSPTVGKQSSHRQRQRKAKTRVAGTSPILVKHIQRKQKLIAKVKESYTCKCNRTIDRTNTARHRTTCPAQAPAFKQRKNHKCPYKGCASHGFTRLDNLRAHQDRQGHFVRPLRVDLEMMTPGDGHDARHAGSQSWSGENYMIVRGAVMHN